MSDWFDREELAPAVLVKKPNPRNAKMACKLIKLEEEIKRQEREFRPSRKFGADFCIGCKRNKTPGNHCFNLHLHRLYPTH